MGSFPSQTQASRTTLPSLRGGILGWPGGIHQGQTAPVTPGEKRPLVRHLSWSLGSMLRFLAQSLVNKTRRTAPTQRRHTVLSGCRRSGHAVRGSAA